MYIYDISNLRVNCCTDITSDTHSLTVDCDWMNVVVKKSVTRCIFIRKEHRLIFRQYYRNERGRHVKGRLS